MRIRNKLAGVAVALAFATAGTIANIGPAYAGSRGQQLDFHDARGDIYSIYVWGYNQDGIWTQQCFNTPSVDNHIDGWWWQGDVTIDGWTGYNCPGAAAWVPHNTWYFPLSQSSDYVTVTD